MRMYKIVPLVLCLAVLCAGCLPIPRPGKIDSVQIDTVESALYAQDEIDDAIAVILEDFKEFKGCTLRRIAYAGDEYTQKQIEWHRTGYEKWDFDELIALWSEFTVEDDRFDGFAKGSVPNWNWLLVRKDGGSWRHVDHGSW